MVLRSKGGEDDLWKDDAEEGDDPKTGTGTL